MKIASSTLNLEVIFYNLTLEKLFCYNKSTSGRLAIASMLVLKGLRAGCLSLVEFSRRVLNYEVVLMAKPYLLTEDFHMLKSDMGRH
jgi:hypothetical protein